jgi:hypothetical protein
MDDKHLAVGSLCTPPRDRQSSLPKDQFFLRAIFISIFLNLKNMLSTHTEDFCGKKWP